MAQPRTRTEKHDCTCAVHRPHGTPHTYRYHYCGCDACLQAHLRYLADLKLNKELGRSAYVAAEPVARRLVLLREHGVPTRQVALDLGYHPGTLYRIAQRQKPLCRRELAEDVRAYPIPKRNRSRK